MTFLANRRKITLLLLLIPFISVSYADEGEPFTWSSRTEKDRIFIDAKIQKDSYLYRDSTKINITGAGGKKAELLKSPPTVKEKDAFNEEHDVYPEGSNSWEYSASGLSGTISASIEFQGCRRNPFLCYPPKKVQLTVQGSQIAIEEEKSPEKPVKSAEVPGLSWKDLAGRFRMAGTAAGYMDSDKFLSFIETSVDSTKPKEKTLFDDLKDRNLLISIFLILIGGLALNLTPCVLPMIPVNLAIIGAGANSSTRLQGFLLGLMYGIGITIAYGLLGLASVLTGSTFGALNSSPFFNFAAALVFIVLALAMFDVIPIDFSRFLKSGSQNKGRSMFTALTMGAISAVLAGACVAPVVIAVLLFSSYLYSQGDMYGLLLPFLLGAGMALPWPFAGAGLAYLPKPGAWMVKVKYAFGIFIMLIAVYYAYAGYSILAPRTNSAVAEGWMTSVDAAFGKAAKEKMPLIIDFTASWCKNCEAMDLTTLKNKKVTDKLEKFIRLKYQAENPNDPATKEVLSYFQILGLPTYLILLPQDQ